MATDRNPSEFGGKRGLVQLEEDGHSSLTPSEKHSLVHRHGEDTPEARRGKVNKLHRQGLVEEA